jgi:hypothetical protein
VAPVTQPPSPIWWLHPAALFALVSGGVLASCWAIPAETFETTWGVRKYLDEATLLAGAASIALFAIGVALSRPWSSAAADDPRWRDRIHWPTALSLFRLCSWLCFAGYAIWVGAAIARGASLDLVLGVLTGEKDAAYTMKDTYLITVGGLTTLTQFGIAAVILGAILAAAGHARRVLLPLSAVFALAAVRSVFNSERLALIELVVPTVVVLLQLPAATVSLRRRAPWLFYLLPPFAAAAVFLLFTGSEYLRSWVNHYAAQSASVWEFAATRLSGYYVTALNNSAYLLQQSELPIGAPYYSVLFLWKFPLLSDGMRQLFPAVMTGNRDIFTTLLENGTNPEFNNNGGLLLTQLDFGLYGGLFYWLLAGAACGLCYRHFRRNSLPGLLFYPIFFLTIIELPRIIYWAEGRIFPSLLILLIACRLLPAPVFPAPEART